MSPQNTIKIGQTTAPGAVEAVRAFYAAVVQPQMALVVFFCSSQYDIEALAVEMRRLFDGVQVVGCTTAGEIGPAGYREHSITGASFPAGSFVAVSGCIDRLQHFEIARSQTLVQSLMQRLESLAPATKADNTFTILLTDGMSIREEPLTRALQTALGTLPLVGGSAGDDLGFKSTHVFFEGTFRADSAVLILCTTPLPFRIFKTQHFVPTAQRVVVTAADSAHRIVKEIDGWPAADAYARLIGGGTQKLDPTHFATSPVLVLIDGTNYVRSIQKANPDGSLTFFCAIEEGMVLHVGHGVDLVENLEQAFAEIHAAIGRPQLVVGFDCVLRKLEIVERGLTDRVGAVFGDNNAIGFNSYGEQYRGVHVNQTLVGLAIGTPAND